MSLESARLLIVDDEDAFLLGGERPGYLDNEIDTSAAGKVGDSALKVCVRRQWDRAEPRGDLSAVFQRLDSHDLAPAGGL